MRPVRWLALAALGPITGPLVAGFLRHRRRNPVLAGLYLAAIPSALWLLTLLAGRLIRL